MNFTIADTASQWHTAAWNNTPGDRIADLSKDSRAAKLVFSKFVKEKIPKVKEWIGKLVINHHISEMHLPLNLQTIFLNYIEEQLELYQCEQDERDLELDQKWQEARTLFAQEGYLLFINKDGQFSYFINVLKEKLKKSEAMPVDFEQTVQQFLEIMNTSHVRTMTLAAFYMEEANRPLDYPRKELISTLLPYNSLKSSFDILLKQLQQNHEWVAQKVLNKLGDYKDKENERMLYCFKKITEINLCLIYENFEITHENLKMDLHSILSLDLDNDETVEACICFLNEHIKFLRDVFKDKSGIIKDLKDKKDKNQHVIKNPRSGMDEKYSREEFLHAIQFIGDFHDCALLVETYFSAPCCRLVGVMISLRDAAIAMNLFGTSKVNPPMAKDVPPLLPVLQQRKYNKIFENELIEKPSSRKKPKNRKKVSNVGKNLDHKENIPPEGVVTPKPEIPLKEVVAALKPKDPLETLQIRLHGLYSMHESSFLRQAIWHLDALMVFHASYGKGSIGTKGLLNYLDGVGSGSGKLLEQVYRLLQEQQGGVTTIHNLKQNHRRSFSSPCPEIVKELCQSSHWTRYFYSDYQMYGAVTMHQVQIPQLLADLKRIAEGANGLSEAEIKGRADAIIRKTCIQVEYLLGTFKGAEGEMHLPQVVSLEIKPPIHAQKFQQISSQLGAFLQSAKLPKHHPAYMHVRQAMAALQMLESSLEKMNQEPDSRALPVWTSWSLQQLQESIEDLLHGIEFLKTGKQSSGHALGAIAASLNIDMGSLAADFDYLSYKPRYPAQNLVKGKGAQIVDDVEAIRLHPDLFVQGFSLEGSLEDKLLWTAPRDGLTLSSTLEKFTTLINDSELFLSKQVIPALKTAWNDAYKNYTHTT